MISIILPRQIEETGELFQALLALNVRNIQIEQFPDIPLKYAHIPPGSEAAAISILLEAAYRTIDTLPENSRPNTKLTTKRLPT